MDPLTVSTLASLAVSIFSALLSMGRDEISKSAFKDVYTRARGWLVQKPEGKEAVEKFEEDPTEGAAAFQSELIKVLSEHAVLARSLARALEKFGVATPGTLVGEVEAEEVVAAGEVWAFWAYLRHKSNATPDLKFGWSVPSGTTMSWNYQFRGIGEAGPNGEFTETSVLVQPTDGTINTLSRFIGFVAVGGTGGTVNFQWAQNTAAPPDSFMRANSYPFICCCTGRAFSSTSASSRAVMLFHLNIANI